METNTRLIVKSIVGDLRQGGSLATVGIDGDTDAVAEGRNVRLLGRSFAGGTDTLGFAEIFNGHVLATPSFTFDAFTSQAQAQVGTANYLMRAGHLQGIGFVSDATPANSHQIANMTIADCFEHIIDAHCNFIFNATTMPDGIITEEDIDTSDTAVGRLNVHKSQNFWNALVSQLGGGEEGGVQFYRPYFDRKNKLYYQPAPHFLATPPTTRGTITKDHIRGKPQVTVRNSAPGERVGQVQIVAVQSSNSVLTAKYPASQPGDGKIVVKDSGIWADTQGRADTLAQNLYEWLTRPYTIKIEVDPGVILFADDGLGIDIGNKVTVNYDGPTEDTATGAGMHINFSNQDFFVYRYSVTYDPVRKMGRGTLELEADN